MEHADYEGHDSELPQGMHEQRIDRDCEIPDDGDGDQRDSGIFLRQLSEQGCKCECHDLCEQQDDLMV